MVGIRELERKYFVKSAYRTNLDSLLTKVHCIDDDMREGKYDTVEIMGKMYDVVTIDELIDELRNLINLSYGKVTGKEYARIKAISEYRDLLRYATCIANGMDECKAAYAFMS